MATTSTHASIKQDLFVLASENVNMHFLTLVQAVEKKHRSKEVFTCFWQLVRVGLFKLNANESITVYV